MENNRSDLSVGDVSTWIHLRTQIDEGSESDVTYKRPSTTTTAAVDPLDHVDTDMHNFKEMLAKIREIMEGS